MRSNKIEEYKKTLELTDYQREIMIGALLGDGHLETQNNGRTYRLKIEHSWKQKEYVDWLYEIFKEWILTPPQEKNQIVDSVIRKKYWFSTVSHGALRFYAQQFYQEKIKILPKFINKWLSPLAIAIWFMDDGSIKSKRHRGLILNTQSFTKRECQRLIEVLRKKFGIETKLRPQTREGKKRYQLYILGVTVKRFVEIVNPYILPSMKYKLGINLADKS